MKTSELIQQAADATRRAEKAERKAMEAMRREIDPRDIVFIGLAIVVVLLLIGSLTGCVENGILKPGSPVTREEIPVVTVTDVAKDAPDVAKLLRDLGITGVKLEEAVKVQKELLAQKAQVSAEADKLRADLERQRSQAQAAINEAAAAKDSENRTKEAMARAEIERADADAKVKRQVSYAVAGVGILCVLAAAAVMFVPVIKDLKMGGGIAVLGIGLILVAAFIPSLETPIIVAACAALAAGVVYLIGSLATRLWWQWQTNQQARALADQARLMLAVGDPVDVPQAASMLAASSVLEHVGTVKYDRKSVKASAAAVMTLSKRKVAA